jgi:transcriptional regulator with XRE-family HTH domain
MRRFVDMETIQERIKSRRLQLKLTLEDVANALGVNKTTVMRYESESIKKLPTDIVPPLAKALKCTPQYLMGWEDLENESYILTDHEREHLDIYRSLDDKGQHTVDTVTQMEYERVKKDNK